MFTKFFFKDATLHVSITQATDKTIAEAHFLEAGSVTALVTTRSTHQSTIVVCAAVVDPYEGRQVLVNALPFSLVSEVKVPTIQQRVALATQVQLDLPDDLV